VELRGIETLKGQMLFGAAADAGHAGRSSNASVSVLFNLAEETGAPVDDGIEIPDVPSHEKLAAMVGATRQWVSVSLERFRARGLIGAQRRATCYPRYVGAASARRQRGTISRQESGVDGHKSENSADVGASRARRLASAGAATSGSRERRLDKPGDPVHLEVG